MVFIDSIHVNYILKCFFYFDVALSLCKVQCPKPGWALSVLSVGFEYAPPSLPLSTDYPTHPCNREEMGIHNILILWNKVLLFWMGEDQAQALQWTVASLHARPRNPHPVRMRP